METTGIIGGYIGVILGISQNMGFLELTVQGLGFRVHSGFRLQGLGFGVGRLPRVCLVVRLL